MVLGGGGWCGDLGWVRQVRWMDVRWWIGVVGACKGGGRGFGFGLAGAGGGSRAVSRQGGDERTLAGRELGPWWGDSLEL